MFLIGRRQFHTIFYTLAAEFPHAKSPKLPDLADAVMLPTPTPQQASP